MMPKNPNHKINNICLSSKLSKRILECVCVFAILHSKAFSTLPLNCVQNTLQKSIACYGFECPIIN